MKIFVIIVTYNGMKWIDQCLQSLQRSIIPVMPVVIDNCSTDGSRLHIPSKYPDVIWMPQDNNLGFGKANNIGIRYALAEHADYVLLLNQDAYLKEDAIKQMLEISDGESLISPVHLNGKGDAVDRMFNLEICLHERSEIYDDLFSTGNLQRKYEIGYVCAACWFIPRKVIEKVGGFDPLFFHYGEDYNYYHRLKFHNVKVWLCPNAKVRHDRELYGNIKTFNKKNLRRTLLINVCDINKSFLKSLLLTSKVLIQCYFFHLRKKMYFPGQFTYEFIWICLHAYSIIKHRNINKEGGLLWLL